MSKIDWLNTKTVINKDAGKPCKQLKCCPYGELIEAFPFSYGDKRGPMSCHEKNGTIITFGHDCPVHYLAEFLGNYQ